MQKQKIILLNIVLFTTILLSAYNVKAQSNEGTIRYLCTSNWSKMMMHVDYISKIQRDRNMYMWGSRSEWKYYTILHFNATTTKYEASEEEAEPGSEGWSNRKEVFFMKRDFTTNTLYDGMTLLGKTYLIHDTIQPPAWKILNDMKEVAGHICMNASITDTIRMQTTEVWFALDMPISSGPDRFIGLPGMILEVNINDGALVMTADKIDLKKLTNELDVPQKLKGKKINMQEYNTLFYNQVKERKANEEPWFWGLKY